MQINLYNKEDSKIKSNWEFYMMSPCLLIADKVMFNSVTAISLMMYIDIDNWNEKMILLMYKQTFHDDKVALENMAFLDKNMPLITKIKQQKHKDKNAVILLHNFKSGIDILKKRIKDYLEFHLRNSDFFQLIPFVLKDIIELRQIDAYIDKMKENVYIPEIFNDIIQRKHLLLLHQSINELFTFTTPESTEEGSFDFVKITLWDLPPIKGLTYEQLKYTREDLQAALAPFKSDVEALFVQLAGLPWTNENINPIKQLCLEKLMPHKTSVQQTIDQSIYLMMLKNKFPSHYKIRCCMGISSAETVLNFYEKNEMVLPYVANELKQQIGRNMDLKSTYPFIYFEIYGKKNDQNA
ncbi:MAG: hypothetical protein WCH34_01160 [Bacteroidota bacterium]